MDHRRHTIGGGSDGFEPEAVRVRLLGGFSVSVGLRTVGEDEWRLRKAASLVRLLALAEGHALHRDAVIALLWPDLGTKPATNNLHRAIHFARSALRSDAPGDPLRHLVLDGDRIVLYPDAPMWTDVEAFEQAAATARRARHPAAYRAALDLYAGELLPEDRYEPWTEEKREELRRVRHALLVELAGLYEELGEYGPAVETLQRAVAEEPVDEETNASLMRLYALQDKPREALQQYERLRRALSSELDTKPGLAIQRTREEIGSGVYPAVPVPSAAPATEARARLSNLPVPLTSFVGREGELVEVKRALSMTDLLTLTGTGGSGKTRLALEAARDLVGAYPGGVWLVELAPLSDPALVPRAVAAALDVREQPNRPLTRTLRDYLDSRQTLLVLDNCEHLVAAAALLVRELSDACPGLRVLATSREPLGVPGESVWPVSTLSLPDPEAEITVESLMGAEAVRLFVERARARLPDFRLTPHNAGAVAEVCRKLEGIPLAIELSTARMGALAVGQVAERLEDSLGLLTGGGRTVARRHQTLRATLDWSHDLLDEAERALFRRLSVFAGGFTLEAAEAVGTGEGIEEGDVPDLLSRLVDKSMVVVEADDGGRRYGMLEPVRQYGRERLEGGGEAGAARRRHASWFFELAREIEPWLRGARHEVWLERLEREYGNLRAALEWALESGESELGLWFGAALAEFWYMSGYLSEGRGWLEAALASGDDASPARARALARAGWIAWEQGDYGRSVALSGESLALARGLGDDVSVVAALSSLGWAALLGNELERATALAEEAVTLARSQGDTGGVARALLILGLAAVGRGDHARAVGLHEESLVLAHEAKDDVAVALSLVMGVFACLGRGDGPRAEQLCEESLALPPQPRVMNVAAFQLSASAALAGFRGRPARSARLWGAAESLRETIGAMLSPVERRVYAPYIEAARAGLGEVAWEEARAEGKAMFVEEAIAYAAVEGDGGRQARPRQCRAPRDTPAAAQPDDPLTRRQREVALLVARGLTNRRIADALEISENTAANHVAAIIARLQLPSRARIASWVTERRPRATE